MHRSLEVIPQSLTWCRGRGQCMNELIKELNTTATKLIFKSNCISFDQRFLQFASRCLKHLKPESIKPLKLYKTIYIPASCETQNFMWKLKSLWQINLICHSIIFNKRIHVLNWKCISHSFDAKGKVEWSNRRSRILEKDSRWRVCQNGSSPEVNLYVSENS